MQTSKNYLLLTLGLATVLACPDISFARPKIVTGHTYCDCSCHTAETNKSLTWEKVASCALNGGSCKADGKPGTLANCLECKGDSSGGYSSCKDAKKRPVNLPPVLVGKLLTQMAADVASLEDELSTPDLVPLTTPGAVAPEGFCRRNDKGQLLVKVYNQGTGDAEASKTFVAFAGGAAQSLQTAAVAGRTETELAVDIPNSCFDQNNRCSFTIVVDGENAVLESDEANNGVAGVCGAQFQ